MRPDSVSICGTDLPANKGFRSNVLDLISNKWFDNFITFVIIANCILMIYEKPKDAVGLHWQDYFETVFIVIYSIEMMLKIIALGFAA